MREEYLKFTCLMTEQFQKVFRRWWWYTALHEKNINRFRSYHDLAMGCQPRGGLWRTRALLSGVRKYFVFVGRKFVFGGCGKIKITKAGRLIVSYPNMDIAGLYDKSEAYLVLMPQKKGWCQHRAKSDREFVIDNFVGWWDVLAMPFRMAAGVFFFLLLSYPIHVAVAHHSKKIFGRNVWKYFREEIWRSFVGDVAVEGRYYDTAFCNMAGVFEGRAWQVLYPYEGRAWEKALCFWFIRAQATGILSSVPARGTMHYHYHPDEAKLMPKPKRLGVPGQQAMELMAETYGPDVVFVLGTTRYQYLLEADLTKAKTPAVLIVLGGVDAQAQELVDVAADSMPGRWGKKIFVAMHPDNKKVQIDESKMLLCDYREVIGTVSAVVVYDSTVAIEAAALQAHVFRAKMRTFVDQCPLEAKHQGRPRSRGEILDYYLAFKTRGEMRQILG